MQEQNVHCIAGLISQHAFKVILVCVAYDHRALRHLFVCFQQFGMPLEIALASFVKNKIVGAGIIAVIRQDKITLEMHFGSLADLFSNVKPPRRAAP